MIGNALLVLKSRLNTHLKSLSGSASDDAAEDKVRFLDLDQKGDATAFALGAITVLLYRIEQETAVRRGDPFVRVTEDGASSRIRPDVSLNIHALFVAKFKDYEQGLRHLSEVIRFFQSNNVFNRQNAPELGADILEMAVDLVTMTVQQQNELWGLLRTAYLPSVAYKIRTITFVDEDAPPPGTAVSDMQRRGLT